jgi:OmpA-OmpF porin, OOP family
MRHSFGAILGCAFALATSGLAYAQTYDQNGNFLPDPEGPYIGAAGGGNFMNDVSPHGAGADTRGRFDDSYVGLGTAGYNFGNGFRTELEGGYRRNDVDHVRGAAPGSSGGALGMYTVMVNGLYDFDVTRYGVPSFGLVPHVGVGVGWAQPRFDHASSFNGNSLSGKDNLFAYQGIVGVDYAVVPHVKMTLDYHYLGTDNGDFHVTPGNGSSSARTSITDQAVLLGVRYEFGEPPPAPMPAAAPPVTRPAPAPVAEAPEAQRAFQVFFDFDRSDLTSAARQVIQSAASTAKSGNFVHLVVTGHTDTVGSAK